MNFNSNHSPEKWIKKRPRLRPVVESACVPHARRHRSLARIGAHAKEVTESYIYIDHLSSLYPWTVRVAHARQKPPCAPMRASVPACQGLARMRRPHFGAHGTNGADLHLCLRANARQPLARKGYPYRIGRPLHVRGYGREPLTLSSVRRIRLLAIDLRNG